MTSRSSRNKARGGMGKAQDVRLPAFPGREQLICNLCLVRIMLTESFDIYDASTLQTKYFARETVQGVAM